MNHPTDETLINYIEGHLPESDRAQTESHLAGPCQQCAARLARIRVILESMASPGPVLPSSEVLGRAVAIFRERSAAASRSPLRVLAELLFDSRLQMSPAAARGAAHTRQLLFATEKVDIDLNISPEHKEHTLLGQILDRQQADAHPPAFVTLQNDSGTVVSGMEVDTLGQFTFRHVPSGVYDLVADLGDQEVAITALELGND